MSQLSVSGAVSGVDTASIINQLVAVQQNQQKLLSNEQSQQQKAADTYGTLITALGGLATQAKALAATSSWKGATATSSATSVVAAATGNTAASLTFDVTDVAAAHALISHEAVAALSSNVASGPLTLTKSDGTTSTIDVGTGSLSDVAAGINASSSGLVATAVQTSPGQYRLQVAATSTGVASSFSIAGLNGFTAMDVLTTGADAVVHVGSDPATAYDVSSSTNTFDKLVPGLSFTVSKRETGVTVSSALDGAAVAGDISKFVDTANGVLASLKSATSWDPKTKTGGPLIGDSTARSLQQSILSLVSGAGAAGVSLTRDGTISFDSNAFTTAFKADPNKVMAAYGAQTTFAAAAGVSGPVTYVAGTQTTRAGSYALNIVQAASREAWQVAPGAVAGKTLTLTRDTTTVSYTAGPSDTLADAITALNVRSSEAGFGVSAAAGTGGTIVFTADAAGSASRFTAALDGVTGTQNTVGFDVAGSIDGQDATGIGDVLSLTSGTGGAVGLSIRVGVTGADLSASGGDIGTISYAPGLAQRFTTLVSDATTSGTGLLVSAQLGRQNQVKSFQDQIDNWDLRLATYRATLQKQFTAMETSIAALKSSSSFLSGLSTSMLSGSSSG